MRRSVPSVVCAALLAWGCSSNTPASTEPPSTDPPASSATAATTGAAAEVAPLASASPAASSAAAPTADTRAFDACQKLCDRVASSCPQGRDEMCRAQCKRHDGRPDGCEAEGEAAFLCQLKATESFCDSVVSSSCVDAFSKMKRCQRGEAKAAPVASGAPEGWSFVNEEAWGVAALMPPGATVDAQAKARTWKASRASALYEITELPRPKKVDSQSMIKLVIGHLGVSCQKDMRLTGLVETDKLISSGFETSCSDGKRVHGKLRIDAQRALCLVVRGEADGALRDAFLYGVR